MDEEYSVLYWDTPGSGAIRKLVHSPLVFITAEWVIQPMQTLHEGTILEKITSCYQEFTNITVIILFPQGSVTCNT